MMTLHWLEEEEEECASPPHRCPTLRALLLVQALQVGLRFYVAVDVRVQLWLSHLYVQLWLSHLYVAVDVCVRVEELACICGYAYEF